MKAYWGASTKVALLHKTSPTYPKTQFSPASYAPAGNLTPSISPEMILKRTLSNPVSYSPNGTLPPPIFLKVALEGALFNLHSYCPGHDSIPSHTPCPVRMSTSNPQHFILKMEAA